MRTVLAIINPIAGVRPKDEVPTLLRQVLTPEDFDLTIRYTEYAGHASVLATEAVRQGVDTVIAVGGDGTINETAKSLVGSPVKFGIVPMGSGNGLARHIQIPLDLTHAIECIRDGHFEPIDYGTVNDHIFFCTAGVGFDAQVSAKFAEMGSRGPISYMRSVMSLVKNYKPKTYVIQTDDGRVREKAVLIAIGNASQWGNNVFITPHASMQDGQLDVTLIKPFPIIELAHILVQLLSRQITNNSNTLSFRSENLRIIMPHRDVVHVDGEPIPMDGVLDIRTHAGQLNIICPAEPSNNVFEPIQYAFEDIHYSIQSNIRRGVRQLEELNRPMLRMAETIAKPVLNPLMRRNKPNGSASDDDEPMVEP